MKRIAMAIVFVTVFLGGGLCLADSEHHMPLGEGKVVINPGPVTPWCCQPESGFDFSKIVGGCIAGESAGVGIRQQRAILEALERENRARRENSLAAERLRAYSFYAKFLELGNPTTPEELAQLRKAFVGLAREAGFSDESLYFVLE